MNNPETRSGVKIVLILLFVALILGLSLLWIAGERAEKLVNELGITELDITALKESDSKLLFLGNSLVRRNELDTLVRRMLEEQYQNTKVTSMRIAPRGFSLAKHVMAIKGEVPAVAADSFLGDSADPRIQWDFVVLQEQSQLLALDADNAQRRASFEAAKELQNFARRKNADAMLLMTWGYRDGDRRNKSLFPNFLVMQQRLIDGYLKLAASLGGKDAGIVVAPAGLAFQQVFQDDSARETSPELPGSRFYRLYAKDGKHPSLAGSYLAASVIVATLTGNPTIGIAWTPRNLDEGFALYLRGVADRIVLSERLAD